jgi:hypothetical protein
MKKTKPTWRTIDSGILERRDGKTFRARIVRIIDGKPKQFTRNADTKSEAKRFKEELEDKFKHGVKEGKAAIDVNSKDHG